MKVSFKQPRLIDGVKFPAGIQEVDDSLADHWYFKANVINGDIAILEKKAVTKVEYVTQAEAEKMVESGEATISEEDIEEPKKRGRKPKV